MARLIYSAITSLDGYVADEDGNFDWAMPDEDVHAFVNDLDIGGPNLATRAGPRTAWCTSPTGREGEAAGRAKSPYADGVGAGREGP